MEKINNQTFCSSPYEREKSIIRNEALVLAFCMLLMLFLSAFLQNLLLGTGRLINKDLAFNPVYKEITVLISYSACLLVPFSLFGAYTKIPVENALKNRRTGLPLTLASLFVSLGVSVVGMFSSAALTFILSRLGIVFAPSLSFFPQEPLALILYILNMTAVPAILEEIAFRGFVLQSLRRFGDGFALIASSLCFALVHVVPTRFPHTFIMGLVIGYFVLFTGSLRTGVIIHLVYNSILTGLSFASDRFYIDSSMLNATAEMILLFLALPSLIYLLRRYRGMFTLKRGRAANSARVNIETFLKSRGMVFFYICVFILSIRSMTVL